MLKRVLIAVAITAAGAASANAATVQMNVTPQVSKSSPAFPAKGGGYVFGAPYTSFKFDVQVLNDGGTPAGSYSAPGPVTVQIVARTGSGETVAVEQSYYGEPISRTVWLKENTIYYARVLPSAPHGIAAQTDSNTFTARAYLKHYPTAFHNSFNRTLTFSGFFSRVEGLPASNTVRVQIQRKLKNGRYAAVATLRPNARGQYRRVIRYGTVPSAYRVRVIAVGRPKRYVTVDDYRHCIATTRTKAAQVCRAVSLGVR